MELRARVNAALKEAMKAKEAQKLSTLRLMTDDVVLAILGKMVKQRQESAKVYEEGGRLELAEKEREEIGVIETFLPRQLSEDETDAAVSDAIAAVDAQSIRDMGKVMGVLKGKYTGQMDFGKVGALVKSQLG